MFPPRYNSQPPPLLPGTSQSHWFPEEEEGSAWTMMHGIPHYEPYESYIKAMNSEIWFNIAERVKYGESQC